MRTALLVKIFLFIGFFIQAQVGINTSTPHATLDVNGKPTDNTVLDGIIAPRITGDQLRAKTYTAAQTGAMVYVSAADTAPAGQTIDVTSPGYYYFNGIKWVTYSSGSVNEQDGIIGNEVVNSTANGGLIRAGSGTTVSPYTLGLISGTTVGDLMTWDGTQWLPSAAINIYNSDGSLTNYRKLNLNNYRLSFTGTEQETNWDPSGSLSVSNLINSGGQANFTLDGGNNSTLSFQQFYNGDAQVLASGNATSFELGTNYTTSATGTYISFATSPGANMEGEPRMYVQANGNVKIGGNPTATEKLDMDGTARIRILPKNGSTNAINTTPDGDLSSSQDQAFTATKTVVADANGVLGYVDGPPFYQNIRGNVITITGGYTVTANDYLIVTNAATGGSTITFPNLTAAEAGRTVQIFNNNSSGAANNLIGTTTILGQIGNNAQRGRTLIWTGSVWVSIGI